MRSLLALESDAFEQLPGGILGKGIVRSYVRCLGLDENEWVARFLDASGQNKESSLSPEQDWVAFAMNVSTNRVPPESDLRLRWVGVVALLVLLCGLGWVVWGFVHQRITARAHPIALHGSAEARMQTAPVGQRSGQHLAPFTAQIRTS